MCMKYLSLDVFISKQQSIVFVPGMTGTLGVNGYVVNKKSRELSLNINH